MRRCVMVVVFALGAGLAACSLLVDTSGLAGDASDASTPEAGPNEGGGPDVVTPTDGGDAAMDAGADAWAMPACDGGFVTKGWAGFDPQTPTAKIDGDVLTGTVTTTTKDQSATSAALLHVAAKPTYVHVAYDIELHANDHFYLEPGCTIVVRSASSNSLLRSLPYLNGDAFGEYLNVYTSPDNHMTRERAFGTVGTTPTTHHVDVTMTTSGRATSVFTVVDGAPGRYDVSLFEDATNVEFFCGIQYASQTATVGGSTSVAMRALELAVCP